MGKTTTRTRQRRTRARLPAVVEAGNVPAVSETDDMPASDITHPEEMTADVHIEAGTFSMQAHARATPAGFIGIGVLLLGAAALVWAVRRGA